MMTTLNGYFLLIIFTILMLVLLQRLLFRNLTNKMGYKSVYISAVIGTPIHELSHAIMCIPFGHKINQIKFFSPDNKGTLGFVTHSYNNRNMWHVIGNFFIGIAPLLGGSICLYLLCHFLLPSGNGVLDLLLNETHFIKSASPQTELFNLLISLIKTVATDAQSKPFQTFIWAYLCGSVALHLTPSKPDLKGALWGGILFATIIIGTFILTDHFNIALSGGISTLTSLLHAFSMMLVLALIFALVLLIFITALTFIFKLLFASA